MSRVVIGILALLSAAAGLFVGVFWLLHAALHAEWGIVHTLSLAAVVLGIAGLVCVLQIFRGGLPRTQLMIICLVATVSGGLAIGDHLVVVGGIPGALALGLCLRHPTDTHEPGTM